MSIGRRVRACTRLSVAAKTLTTRDHVRAISGPSTLFNKKFTDVTVGRGKTVYPKSSADQERVGVRWDYDGEVSRADGVYNKFQMQPNAGKVPSSIRQWRVTMGVLIP
ncbi:hypothetical protein BDW02DRAFT_567776 [Decorospora gaudefroyi]|uniref:Uncharacterized protein n=1 Tax=Decorospora gaudefroyi TaxID=184978 RepID=A0A6A5KJT7_9PLEO|nr:hypothetical protein BDW02DRAFT_567776 [Decorospora gaudefroyi]